MTSPKKRVPRVSNLESVTYLIRGYRYLISYHLRAPTKNPALVKFLRRQMRNTQRCLEQKGGKR